MFTVETYQLFTREKVTVFIKLADTSDGDPNLRVIKRYDFELQRVEQAEVFSSLDVPVRPNTTEALEYALWWRLAAQAARILDQIFDNRESLKTTKIEFSISGDEVVAKKLSN